MQTVVRAACKLLTIDNQGQYGQQDYNPYTSINVIQPPGQETTKSSNMALNSSADGGPGLSPRPTAIDFYFISGIGDSAMGGSSSVTARSTMGGNPNIHTRNTTFGLPLDGGLSGRPTTGGPSILGLSDAGTNFSGQRDPNEDILSNEGGSTVIEEGPSMRLNPSSIFGVVQKCRYCGSKYHLLEKCHEPGASAFIFVVME